MILRRALPVLLNMPTVRLIMPTVRLIVPTVGLIILVAAGFSAGERSWTGRTESSDHFTYYFHAENMGIARGLLAVAEREYERVSDIIGYRPQTIELYLARDRSEFTQLTSGALPEWGIGAAVPAKNRVVLIASGRDRANQDLRQILAHELSHVILGQALKTVRPPRWLDEGVAMYISHEWRLGQSVLVARALLFGSLIPLGVISQVNTFNQTRASLAYAESFLAVAFIVEQFGEDALRDIIGELGRSGDIDLAMGISLGMTYREFLRHWQDEVVRRFNWISIVSDPIVLWTLMLSLFVLVFFLKRRHTRRTLKRWQLMEEGFDEGQYPEDSSWRWTGPRDDAR
jgi:hypothetical protein